MHTHNTPTSCYKIRASRNLILRWSSRNGMSCILREMLTEAAEMWQDEASLQGTISSRPRACFGDDKLGRNRAIVEANFTCATTAAKTKECS